MLRVSRVLCVVVALTAFSVHAQPKEHVIVELRSAAYLSTQPARAAALATFRRDLEAIVDSPSIRREYSVVFHGAALQIEATMLPAIAALPYVEAIHPDEKVDALALHMRSSRVPASHAGVSSRGEGVTVAILDSGIDYTHPALGSGFGPGFKVAGGYDFVNGDADPRDDNGHGTHVAGIIAAESDEMTGIAPRSTLVAYKVLDAVGSGRQSDVIAALERVVDPNGDGDPSDHLDVANLSLGGVGTPDDAQSRAVDAAVAAGVIVCVAAGNDGDSFDMPLSPAGADQIEFVTRGLSTSQQPMRAMLSTNVASTAAITSMAILDAAGTMTPALKRYESGALLFTAASPLRMEETRVWFRRSGTTEWLPLFPVLVNDDTRFAETPLGIQFIADLATATSRGGTIDLRISVADLSGNATILTLEPAFSVSAGRSRAVAHR